MDDFEYYNDDYAEFGDPEYFELDCSYNGWDCDVIMEVFNGDPLNTWNVD